MPKKNHPKPYAKYPPNVRRMLMRRDAEIERLSEMLHAERGGADAAIAHLKARLAKLMRETAQVTHASEPLPQVETKAGPTWVGVTKKVASPDPVPATVVVRGNFGDLWEGEVCPFWMFDRIVDDGESSKRQWTICGVHKNQPPTTLPAMPGMTLGVPTLNTSPWWRLAFWLRSDTPLTCPAVADSPEGRAAVVGEPVASITPYNPAIWAPDQASWVRFPPDYPGQEREYIYPLPPATWRQA